MKKIISFILFSITISFIVKANVPVSPDSLLKKLKSENKNSEKIKIYTALSKIFLDSNNLKSIEYSEKALEFSEKTKNDTLLINSYINLGSGYIRLYDYTEAMNQFSNSLSLSEKIKYKAGESTSLLNIAIIYDSLKNYKKSKEFYLKALKVDKKSKEDNAAIITLNNLGMLYFKMHDDKKAFDCFNEALGKEKAANEKQLMAFTYIKAGDVSLYNGDKKNASEYYRNALRTSKEINCKKQIIASMISIGKINFVNNKSDSALFYFNSALNIAAGVGCRKSIEEIYYCLSEVYNKKGNTANAFKFYKRYSELKDTLSNEKINNRISAFQFKSSVASEQYSNKLKKKDESYAKMIWNFFAIILLLILVTCFVLFRYFRDKKKLNGLLLAEDTSFAKQKEQLSALALKLDENEDYLLLVMSSPFGITITDLGARITFASPAFLDLYGYDDTENVIGKGSLAFIHTDDWAKLTNCVQNLTHGNSSETIELRGVKKGDAVIDLEINAGVLRGRDGNVKNLFFIFRKNK